MKTRHKNEGGADDTVDYTSGYTRYGLAIGACCGVFVGCIVSARVLSAADGAAGVDHTRTAIEKWVQTQQIISQEKRDWILGREMLSERIELVQREIESLRGKIDEANTSISDADKIHAELVKENERLKSAAETLSKVAIKLEGRTAELIRRLPGQICDRIRPLSQRLPKDPNNTELSLAQRFQNVIGILNEVNKFNQEITVVSEMHSLPDGNRVEVTALYVGLGQGYYTGTNGTVGGVGRPSEDGWRWDPANDVADEVAEAVAILQSEKAASFVSLPADIQ